jgi:hypothetical protein
MTVDYLGKVERISIRNVPGTVVHGTLIQVEILSTDAVPPNPPTPVVASNGVIAIDSFVGSIEVCDHDLGEVIHFYFSRGEANYLGTASIPGGIPGFNDANDTIGWVPRRCSATDETSACELTITIRYYDDFVERAVFGALRNTDGTIRPCLEQ